MKKLSDSVLRGLTRPALVKTIKELQEEIEELKENYIPKLQASKDRLDKDSYELQHRIYEAIDKLYCWGEVLNAEFQNEMLDILQGNKEEE